MRRVTMAVVVCFFAVPVLAADNWPEWRGPSGNGVAPTGDYPTEWSATENVRWKIKLPGPGSSTPIVWEDRIFLTCGVGGSRNQPGNNVVLCLDRSGNTLWQTAVGQERPGRNQKATGSNPSVVTDGERAYAYFKSGDLACLDFEGKILWRHNLQQTYGEDKLWWDLGTSPVLTKDFVVVAVQHGAPSYLVAYEKKSGKLAWKEDRNLGAPVESGDSYTTPLVVAEGDKETIVVLGSDHVTGHDAATGKELWWVEGLNPGQNPNFRSIASPAYADGIVVAPYARGDTLTAIKLGGTGNVTQSHVGWRRDDLGADVPTPIAFDGRLYISGDRGRATCLDLKTGKTLFSNEVERSRTAYSSSPILAGDKLYITREDGKTFVLHAADEFKVLASNEIGGEQTVATPAFVDGQILLRTRENLWCIGKKL